jgi:hypothetical protein
MPVGKYTYTCTVHVEAIQWKEDNFQEVSDFVRKSEGWDVSQPLSNSLRTIITIIKGNTDLGIAHMEDYIVRGITGEIFSYPSWLFEKTYIPETGEINAEHQG